MEDTVSLDAQKLEPWYPSVWSGTSNDEHVSDATAGRRDGVGSPAHVTPLGRFESDFEPILGAVRTIEPVEHDEAEELNLDGVFDEQEDFPVVRFDVGLWNENAHALAPVEPNDAAAADAWSGTEAAADEQSGDAPSTLPPPDSWVFTAKGHRAGRSAKRRKASPALVTEAVAPDGTPEEPPAPAAEAKAAGSRAAGPRAKPHRVRRGGRHRRGRVRHRQDAEPATFLSEELEPASAEQVVLVGIPEGSRFRPAMRVLAIAVPVAGATMAFLTYLR